MNILLSRLYCAYSIVRLGVLRRNTLEPKRKWKMRVERVAVSEWLVKLPAHTMNISLLTHSSFSAGPQETDKDKETETDRQTDRQIAPHPHPITPHGYASQAKSHTPTFPVAGLTGSILRCWQRCLPSPSRAHPGHTDRLTTHSFQHTGHQPMQITCKHETCDAPTESSVSKETDASVYREGSG